MNYGDYLQSDYWKKRRNIFISQTHKRCFICRNRNINSLEVHHKRYKNKRGQSILYNERHQDFRLLCHVCHTKIHKYGLDEVLAQNKMKRTALRDLLYSLE